MEVASEQLATSTAALPVSLELAGPHADAVRRWVEGTLGWQVVADRGATTSIGVPPRVRLTDLEAASAAGAAGPAVDHGDGGAPPLPVVLLVDDRAGAGDLARVLSTLAPDDVVAWPSQREQLRDLVAARFGRRAPGPLAPPALRIGGAAGGVGTTTITLTLAGLLAWADAPALALVRPPAPVPGLVTVAGDVLTSPDLWEHAVGLPGAARSRALGVVGDHGPLGAVGRAGHVLVDAGVDDDVDLLVCRPDAGARRAAASSAGTVVVVGTGPVPPGVLRRELAGRRLLWLPWSARVARAGVLDRVPGALPGRWVRVLAPVVRSLIHSHPIRGSVPPAAA